MKTPARIAAALLTVVLAGCTASGAAEEKTPTAPATTRAQESTTPTPTEVEPEPTPSLGQEGAARILAFGNLEVRATPRSDGVHTTVRVTNDGDEEATYQLKVSIGDGGDWVAHKNVWFQSVAPGATAEDTAFIGGTHLGDIPEAPKIYIDRFEKVG